MEYGRGDQHLRSPVTVIASEGLDFLTANSTAGSELETAI